MSKTLTIVLALTSSGTVDRDATLTACENAIDTYVAERELESETIAKAVHGVFDQYKGASINMPALAGFALQRLNAQPANFNVLEERTMEYVRANAGTRESGAEFAIGKGKGGGVKRWADQPVEAPKPESK